MIKLVILFLFLLLSLLVIFRAPTKSLWYVAILATEFAWVFIAMVVLLFFWPETRPAYSKTFILVGSVTIGIYLLPYLQAWRLGKKIHKDFEAFAGATVPRFQLRPLQALTGIGNRNIPYQQFDYDSANCLSLDFYPSQKAGFRPCIIIIHGGSWAAGDSRQLPELNSDLAKAGYHVASISYRLAPKYQYPAPLEDVQAAIRFLQNQSAALAIDSNKFVLLGRSAGGQIALSAAYRLQEPCVKAVINFYGPTDMVWGYENPTSPLVLDSRKIMEDYLGGTLHQVRDQYIHSSATETVTSHAPPTLMIYAENDPLVSPRHGTRLSLKLKAASIPHFELYLPWGTHGFDYTLNGPGGQLSTWMVTVFLQAIFREERT